MELKRRNLSGLFIFDTFPGEDKHHPTCLEDCQQETRREWCLAQTQERLRLAIEYLARTFKELVDYLVDEKVVNDEQRKKLFAMIDRNMKNSEQDWTLRELADQVDFFCGKVTMLADVCGVTKDAKDNIE